MQKRAVWKSTKLGYWKATRPAALEFSGSAIAHYFATKTNGERAVGNGCLFVRSKNRFRRLQRRLRLLLLDVDEVEVSSHGEVIFRKCGFHGLPVRSGLDDLPIFFFSYAHRHREPGLIDFPAIRDGADRL